MKKIFLLLLCAALFAACQKDINTIAANEDSISADRTLSLLADTPTVKFTFPKKEDTVFGTITIKIKASSNVAITSVELKIDGVSLGIKTSAPYNFNWDTKTVMNGAHQLLAKATDASGKSAIKKIIVNILNKEPLSMEQELLNLINAERSSRGLQTLTLNSSMLNAVRFHAQDMANNSFYGHVGFGGDDLGMRLNDFGYPWVSAGENLAGGQNNALDVFNAWMAQSGYRLVMLDPNYKDGAVGCGYRYNSAYEYYWVLNVGRTQ